MLQDVLRVDLVAARQQKHVGKVRAERRSVAPADQPSPEVLEFFCPAGANHEPFAIEAGGTGSTRLLGKIVVRFGDLCVEYLDCVLR